MSIMTLDTTVNNKDIKFLPKNIKELEESEDNNFFESIIEELLSGIVDEKSKTFLLEKFLNLSPDIEKDKNIMTSFSGEKLSLDDDATVNPVLVEELLKLAVLLKNSMDEKVAVNFPTDSKKLETLLDNKNFVADVKNTTNIKELLQVAEKYDIKVKNFQFFKEELAQDSQNVQAIKQLKSEDIFKLIENKLEGKVSQLTTDIKNSIPKEHTLKELLSSLNKIKDNKPVQEVKAQEVKVQVSDLKKETKIIVKNSDEKQLDTKVAIKNQDNKLVSQDIKVMKIEQKIEDNLVKTIKVTKVINQVDNRQKKVEVVNNKSLKVDNKIDLKEDIEVKSIPKSELTQKIDLNKINVLQDVKKPQNTLSQLLESVENSESKVVQNSDVEVEVDKSNIQKIQTQVSTEKTSHDKQPVEFKRTFDSFATDFKEKVEAYKPPLMKVKMQLNPMGLGEVDVTIINRGNNLHINVNSNQNTIALFSQNQAEFKTSLVNMGFSELSMNFNENGKNPKDNQQSKRSKDSGENFEEFEQDSENFEIITPRYV